MAEPSVTMVATKAKRYNRANLVPGKTFLAEPKDVKTLRMLGWAKDAPAPKPAKVPKEPVKAGTYLTADLRAEE